MQILIVDDSELSRTLIARNLRQQLPSAQLTACINVAEAIELLNHKAFQLITTSLQLPDDSGLTLVRHVRQQPRHATTPVIVISADICSQRLREGFTVGVSDYFDKAQGHSAMAEFLRDLLLRHDSQSGRVLYVEDSPSSALRVERLLSRHGLQVKHVTSAEQALAQIEQHLAVSEQRDTGFDLVISDYFLSGTLTGDDLVRSLRTQLHIPRHQLPVLIMTANEATHDITEILHAGANDFIAKPIIDEVLITRVQSLLSVSQQARVIRRLNQQLQQTQSQDPLTGLYHLDHFEQLARQRHERQPIALMLIDIDHFKAVNRTAGAEGADELLRQVAQELRQQLADDALIGRLRADLFGVVMTTPDIGSRAEALREHLASCRELRPRITASIGTIDSRDFPSLSWDKLRELAGKAVHSARLDGGNQVCHFTPPDGIHD